MCPNLPYVPHLVIENAAAYKPGSVITFRCESGFVIKGLKAIMCSSAGKLIKHTRKKAAEREREREREGEGVIKLISKCVLCPGVWNGSLPSCLRSTVTGTVTGVPTPAAHSSDRK